MRTGTSAASLVERNSLSDAATPVDEEGGGICERSCHATGRSIILAQEKIWGGHGGIVGRGRQTGGREEAEGQSEEEVEKIWLRARWKYGKKGGREEHAKR